MVKDPDKIVSVRFSDSTLNQLKLIARIEKKSAGSFIREAVKKHIETISTTEEFKSKAKELKEEYKKLIEELTVLK